MTNSLPIRDNLGKNAHFLAGLRYQGANARVEEIVDLPLATQQTKKYMIPLVCSRTGIVVGSFSTITVAGHMPLLGQWKDTQILHPLFSLKPVALLQFSRNTWLRFCALSPEETQDGVVVQQQETQLRVAALCMLHHLTDFRQDISWLPAWTDAANHWSSLMALSYWKAYLDSERFRFPFLRVSKMEPEIDLGGYLQVCWKRKKEYETVVNENIQNEKDRRALLIAEKAMIGIRDDIAGKKPLSIKLLWRWMEQNMPSRYDRDMQGWMWELFSANEKDITDFTARDIELFEEIFLSECPTGSSISYAILEVVRGKYKLLTARTTAYEIIIPESIRQDATGEVVDAGPEPKLADFPTKVKWMQAHAKWRLRQPEAIKHQKAAAAKQREITVRASFIPKLMIGADADEIPEQEEEEMTPSGWGLLDPRDGGSDE